MIPITLAQGDYGRPISLSYCLADGQQLTPAELIASAITMRIYRMDRLTNTLTQDANNNRIDIRRDKLHFYTVDDTISIDNEIMTVASIDIANSFITVTRTAPVYHKPRRTMRHTISDDNTSVVWSNAAGSLVWTPIQEETARVGSFMFQLEIDVSAGTKHAVATMYAWQNPYVLTILQTGSVN